MMSKKLHLLLLAGGMAFSNVINAQLIIDNATFVIQSNATVSVQGDITSNIDITGAGKVLLNGTANQNINTGGFAIPNLEINNAANVTLTGNAAVTTSLLFTSGKIKLGSNNITLAAGCTSSGMGTNKFLETDGTGTVKRLFTADASNVISPVGVGSDYLPVSLTNTGSTYSTASIAVQAKGVVDPNRYPRTQSYLTAYWPIVKTGITGGTTSAVGTYVDPTKVTGTEADIKGMFWNGSAWSLTGGNQNTASNTVGATINNTSGELYGMNTFVLLNAKVFLQGAYNTGSGLMDDKLRNSAAPTTYNVGVFPASNLLPLSDPYRTAPYNTIFTHVNNTTAETTTTTVLQDQAVATDNIVDWLFVELRNTATSGNTVLQTRSVLLQRDGDIVDVDGVSPVYFQNNAPGTFVITVKHRNHLPISINPTVTTQALSLSPNTSLDFTTTSTGNVLGTANTNYYNNGTKNFMYAGNANINNNVKMSGSGNDGSYILGTILSNDVTKSLNDYNVGDVNMNRITKYSGAGNDGSYILSTPLNNVTTAIKSQILPL
ncbi:MAG: hypothetical protein HY305_00330 [Sphingobacteriales bacterium]|nr:hypothetical protein [Sphingobacteriales bacterium]